MQLRRDVRLPPISVTSWFTRLLAAACLLTATHALHAGTPAVIVDRDLRPQPVILQGLDEGALTYFDEHRSMVTRPAEDVLYIRIQQADAPLDGGVLLLTDGQRIGGRWAGASEDNGAIVWEHPRLGSMAVALERVARIDMGPTRSGDGPVEQPVMDQAIMHNGDALSGYVLEAYEDSIAFSVEGHEQPLRLQISDLRSLMMVNEPAEVGQQGYVLGLADGSRLYVVTVRMTSDGVKLTLDARHATGERTLRTEDLVRVRLPSPGLRIEPLAGLPRQVLQHAEVFGVRMTPKYGEASIELHAPSITEFMLPSGARRIGATLRLADQSDLRWADVDVRMHNNGQKIWQGSLSQGRSAVDINVEVTQGALTVELDDAANGPVLDRVELMDAVILVDE